MSEQSGQNQVFVGVSSKRWRKGKTRVRMPWMQGSLLGVALVCAFAFVLSKGRWESSFGLIYACVLPRVFMTSAPRHLLLSDAGMRLQYSWPWLNRWAGKAVPWDALRGATRVQAQGNGWDDPLHDVWLVCEPSGGHPKLRLQLADWLPVDGAGQPVLVPWPVSKVPVVPFWRWRGPARMQADLQTRREELPARIARLPLVQALAAHGVQMPPLGPPLDLAHMGGMESLDPRRMKAVLGVLMAVLLLGVGAWQLVGQWELLAAGAWLWPVSLLLGIGLGVGMAWWPARRVKADPQSPGSLAGVLELLLLAALIAVSVWCVHGVWRAAAVAWGTPQVVLYTPVAPQTWDSSASSKRVWAGPAGMPPLVLYQRKRGPQLQPKAVDLPVLHTWGGLWQVDARVLDALSR